MAASFAAEAQQRVALEVLGFERPATNGVPGGWAANVPGTASVDRVVFHGGRQSVRIERQADSDQDYSAVSISLPVDFAGNQIELHGFLKVEDVNGMAGLFLVEDNAAGRPVSFDNMESRPLKGSADWAEFTVRATIHADARVVRIGALLSGAGKAWVDDLRVFVDGQPLDTLHLTAFESDHTSDAGSRIAPTALTDLQVDTLTLLGKVWGLLKYHDSRVASGTRQWDYDLFRIVPVLLAKDSREAVNEALVTWIDGLGPREPCKPCATLGEQGLQTRPALAWIADVPRLGQPLSGRLQAIVRDRPNAERQFFVSLVRLVGNPSFDHEKNYPASSLDDAGFRLLAVYRFWNVIAYWFPYRELIDDWDAALRVALPKMVMAPDAATYQRELMALIAQVRDTHANLWSSLAVRPPIGACRLPIDLRFVEGTHLVVAATRASVGLAIGDEITAIDDVPIARAIHDRAPSYAASNDAARLRDMASQMTRGPCGPIRLAVTDVEGERTVDAVRVAEADPWVTHDLPGATFRLLSDEVAYLKLSSIKVADVPGYIEAAAKTKGLVIDLRNDPSAYVVYALGNLLVEQVTPFVRFTYADVANPGAFRWTNAPLMLQPASPHYCGKVVILVDETSQSLAEYTTMALRAAPDAVVVGSTTAGADGNVSTIPLPGRLSTMISGLGVFYPDRRPTQRVGIVPDIEVRPTIAGIRAGRDEVLEAGIGAIAGTSR